jgi:hypothetical protein
MQPWPLYSVRSHAGHPARVCVLELRPDRVRLAISIQAAWNGSGGIIRGAFENGVLLEDHMLDPRGAPIFGADEMREGVWTIDEHQSAWLREHPGERVVGWVGNGNLLNNPGFVAGVDGRLFHLLDEPARFAHTTYHCLAVWRDGSATIETFDLSAPLPPGLDCFTSGQRLVEDGRPVDIDTLARDAAAGAYYDLRHLFLFGRIARGPKRWIDAGLSAFRSKGAIERAVRGLPVEADVSQFSPTEVRDAMASKDYFEVAEPAVPGEFSLRGGVMVVVFREGLYPHNMIGIRGDETVLSVVVSGASNRAGVTVRGAAEIMHRLGARDAILIDNGGDVMMSFQGRMVLGSAEDERNRLRSILLFHCPQDRPLSPDDARLTVHPGTTTISECSSS